MVGAGLFREKSTADYWLLMSQANSAKVQRRRRTPTPGTMMSQGRKREAASVVRYSDPLAAAPRIRSRLCVSPIKLRKYHPPLVSLSSKEAAKYHHLHQKKNCKISLQVGPSHPVPPLTPDGPT
jgi:hypothetical protein